LFQHSQVVSVSKWNALLGKEATHLKEMHFYANNEEDESADDEDIFAIVDVADMTESPGKNLVPIDDGSVGDAVLKQTV
jgi:NADH dehydrogenase FAD-containing subunit